MPQRMVRSCLLFLCVCVAAVNQCRAQSYFLKTYGTTQSEFGASLLAMPDSGYLVLGSCFISSTQQALALIRTDRRGDTLWTSTLMVDSSQSPVKLLPADDGGAFVLATCWKNNWNDAYIALMRTDALGDVRWCKKIDASNNDLPNDMVRRGDELIILSTANYNLGTYPEILITSFDTTGNLLWSQQHVGQIMTLPGGLAVQDDGSIAVVAMQNGFGTGAPSFYNGMLLLLNADGSSRNCVSFGTYYDDEWLRIGALPGGDWLVTGRSYFLNSEWDATAFRFDRDGTLIRSRVFDAGTNNGEVFREHLVEPDGSALLIGDKGTFDERNILLTHVDALLMPRFTHEYPFSPNFTNYPFDIVRTTDRGYAITGDLRPPGWYRDPFILKCDTNGRTPCQTASFTFNMRIEPIEVIPAQTTRKADTVQVDAVAVQRVRPILRARSVCESHAPQAVFAEYPSDSCGYCFDFFDSSINDPVSWNWEFPGAQPVMSSQRNPSEICYPGPGTYTVRLTVENAIGSSTTTHSVELEDCTTWFIPNVITPGKDGKNDRFVIRGLTEPFTLRIFNRWGNEVYRTDTLSATWAGESKSDGQVSAGVYFYTLQVATGKYAGQYQGTIDVLPED